MILLPNLLLEVRQVSSMSPNGSPGLSSMSPVHTPLRGEVEAIAQRRLRVRGEARSPPGRQYRRSFLETCDPIELVRFKPSPPPLTRIACAIRPLPAKERGEVSK